MRVYLEIIKNVFQVNITYRINTVFNVLSKFIILFVQICIWRALLTDAQTQTSISLRDMITYVIISAGISIFMDQSVIRKMDSKIKSGDIAMDLIKPFNFKMYQFCEIFANSFYRTFIEFIPLLLFSMAIFGFYFPSIKYLLFFALSLINGIIINFLISYIIGLIGFWYISIRHLSDLLYTLVRLFSGSIVPLWFFPKFLFAISLALPFRFMYFAPISIYLEKMGQNEAIGILMQQLLWIFGLLMIEKITWKKGIKKLVVQGG